MLAIYTRLSKQDDDSNSILNQQREGKRFVEINNYKDNYKLYNEGEGVSGTAEIENRPELFNLISDIKKGEVQTVWMRNQNRLDRNTGTFYLFVSAVKKANVDVYFGDGDVINFNDPTTLLQTSIISSLNQYTAQLQSVQTKKALKDNAAEGKGWSVLQYGYKSDENGYIIKDEEEIEVVKRIYDLSLNNYGTKKITEILNEENVPTRYNKIGGTKKVKNKFTNKEKIIDNKTIKWGTGTIHHILTSTWYKGERTFSGKVYNNIPPIFDVDYWDKVQKNLKKNRTHSGNKSKYNYLLKGLIMCQKCGRNYYGRFREPKNGLASKDNYYLCSSKRYKGLNCGNRSISIPFIENLVWNRFFKEKELNNLITEYFEETNLNDVLNDLKNQIDKLNIQLEKFKSERQRTIKAYRKEYITEKELENDLKSLTQEEKICKKELKNYTEQLNEYQNTIQLKEQQKELDNIQSTISFNDKKELIKKYINSVYILHNDEKKHYIITINFNIGIPQDKYVVTTFKKEVFREVNPNTPFAHKINMLDLKNQTFTNYD